MITRLSSWINLNSLAIFVIGFFTGSFLFSGRLGWNIETSLHTSVRQNLKTVQNGVEHNEISKQFSDSDTLPHRPTISISLIDEEPKPEDIRLADIQSAVSKNKLLCMVNSNPAELDKKATAVNNTWGRRCDILLFVCEKNHPDLPILKVNVSTGREFLSFKHREALDLIYKNYLQEAEWFLKADDDTYVFIDNLREYLADKDYNHPSYYGHHFVTGPKSGYFSGGSGYVFSREAMKRFGERREGDYRNEASFADDMLIGYAMEKLNVAHVDGRDSQNRMLFFPLGLHPHFHGAYPDWYIKYDGYTPPHGVANLTDRPIAFHYITPTEMMTLEYFTYKVKTPQKCQWRT